MLPTLCCKFQGRISSPEEYSEQKWRQETKAETRPTEKDTKSKKAPGPGPEPRLILERRWATRWGKYKGNLQFSLDDSDDQFIFKCKLNSYSMLACAVPSSCLSDSTQHSAPPLLPLTPHLPPLECKYWKISHSSSRTWEHTGINLSRVWAFSCLWCF